MNKLSKIGASALCGSLAAISAADAGDLAVSGGIDMTWISLSDQVTGNPIGIGSNFGVSGSGELDNGWSVKLAVDLTNAAAFSAVNVTVGMPGIGDFIISSGVSGTGIDRMDDKTPNVWEEAYGTGLGSGVDTVAGASGGAGVEFTPSFMPDGLTVRAHASPAVGGSNTGDKSGSGDDGTQQKGGFDVTFDATSDILGVDGLNIYGGVADIEQYVNGAAFSGNKKEKTLGASYAAPMGLTLGYQWSEEDLGRASGALKYTNHGYGVTFSINDDLSIGYNFYKSTQDNDTDVDLEASSFQIAYSMGGLSLRIADAEVDNATYATAATNDLKATTVSVALAF
jgi:hypothetical protein